MTIQFEWLEFTLNDNLITLNGLQFAEICVAGKNKSSKMGAKLAKSGVLLNYVSHDIQNDCLYIIQANDIIEVVSEFKKYKGTTAISVKHTVKNISQKACTILGASFVYGLSVGFEDCDQIQFTRFIQGHHSECQPRTDTLYNLGLNKHKGEMQCSVSHANIGSWSTKDALPQGILRFSNESVLFFQIESNNSWYYEISDCNGLLYVCLDGGNEAFGGWYKTLKTGETMSTVPFTILRNRNFDGAMKDITLYRRAIAGKCVADKNLPTIFNEYMWLSWDSPSEEKTKKYAKVAADVGVEYYVIDCGWHDEVDGSIIYPYVGEWKESKARFPSGLKSICDYIHALGLKVGLWIEPEIIGDRCEKMLSYYDEDCFITRHGQKVNVCDRYFLDFRTQKVRNYLSETVRRMVEDYGADYIKMDYNQCVGVGAERDCDSFGDGLKKCAAAYLSWVDEIRERFPNVIFETCSAGGMRMDYETLKHFSLVSTSDQIDYLKYPHIAGNILAAVLPEQAAVWSYPSVGEQVGKEQVVINMINSFVGRIHLASDLAKLNKDCYSLVCEGVEYSKKLSKIKCESLPCFPLGLTRFGGKSVVYGIETENIIYLAIYNLGGERIVNIPIRGKSAVIAYPNQQEGVTFRLYDDHLEVHFTEEHQARFFEVSKQLLG